MAVLSGLLFLLTVKNGFDQIEANNNLSPTVERLSLVEINQRMENGTKELNAEISDGQIDCSSLNYMETTYVLVYKTYTAYVLITSNDKSIVLWSFYDGTPSCEELENKQITGIVTKYEDAALEGMYSTNLMGIRRFPNANIYRFCGDCTKRDKAIEIFTTFGLALFFLFGFAYSLIYQWKLWAKEEKNQTV